MALYRGVATEHSGVAASTQRGGDKSMRRSLF
jgi:hypothetical protein